ncbi:MAG: hypothetical protein Q7J34_07010 [Bacteroidales bacterium]|nr:hypothetical protein [Bacteroidales bacterium]
MELVRKITDKEIVQFCRATCDYNVIHDPAFMNMAGKRVIVPGMLLFCTIFGKHYAESNAKPDSIRILFNSVVHEGESIQLITEECPDDPNCAYISALNGRDSFRYKDDRSRLYIRSSAPTIFGQGWIYNINFSQDQLKNFQEVVQIHDNDLANILFSVAYASRALLLSIEQPYDIFEEEIANMLNKNGSEDPMSPIYQTLDIYLETSTLELDKSEPLEFLLGYERETLNRTYIAHVQCSHKGKIIYHSSYKLSGIPDRMIMRMAHNLTIS